MKIKTILAFVTIASLLVSIFTSLQTSKYKAESERLESNLYTKTVEYEDKLGRGVTETTQLEIKVNELKRVMKKDSSQLNEYEKKLKHIASELKNSERKAKHLEKALIAELETSITLEHIMTDTVYLGMKAKSFEFEDQFGTYDINYIPATDSIHINLIQRQELYIDMFKVRTPKRNGKAAKIPLKWFKKWQNQASIKSLNDSTTIKAFTVIDIPKKKS